MKNQLIFMNLWHYVEIENVESIDPISNTIISISIVSITFEKLRKIKINNFKIVTIMRNRLKCNDKNSLKDEINAKNAWKILKNSFNSFELKMLNDLLIKLWIIILVNNQNVTNYVNDSKWQCRTFEKWLSTCRSMIMFSFCTFIWILTRSSSNIASIMLKFMRSCRMNRIRLKASITRSIDFWISASIAWSWKN